MPLRTHSDFKQASFTLQRLQQEAGEEPLVPITLTSTNNGSWHKNHLLHGGIGKVPGGLLTIQKVKKEANQILSERGREHLGENLTRMAFTNSIYCYRWIVHSWRRFNVTDGGVKTTPQMTRFRDAKVCNNLVTGEIDDHRIQSDYKCTIGQQKTQKERTLHLVLRLRGKTERQDARHQWQHDHQDPEHLPHCKYHTSNDVFLPCKTCAK